MPSTAREIMSGGVDCIGENETVAEAARKMAQLGVGALPICGEDDRLKGMITDRDITVECVATGADPTSTRAGEFADVEAVTIGADDDIAEALQTMRDHKVRRLPVIDGHDLVGSISQGDLARALPAERVGELGEAISV